MLVSIVPLVATVATLAAQCSLLLNGRGYRENLDGQHGPMKYASSVQDCCAFCDATPGCSLWTWNGPPPGNGDCYAKAANATVGGGSPTMLSGSTRPGQGPPLPPAPPTRLQLVSTKPISQTEPTYASWNIDSSCNRGFHHIQFANPNLAAAAKGLAPSKVRFGGSGNDALTYGLSPGSPECKGIAPQPAGGEAGCGYITAGCLNATHWNSLYNFGQQADAEFIFGVAFGANTSSSYVWDPTNAASLLDYMTTHGQEVFGFELGNEVNNNGGIDDPTKTQPKQQADALKLFAPMVKQKMPKALLIGPDSGYKDAEQWLQDYLTFVEPDVNGDEQQIPLLHAVTHHVYDAPGKSDFNSPSGLNGGLAEIGWYTKVIKEFAPTAQIWAGEDGPIGGGNDGSCGGNRSICTTYASAITYADDLGLRALHGFAQYQRQAFFGGEYGLTDTKAKHPQSALGADEPLLLRPGYWVNFLWKRIFGQQVLNITSSSENVRAYGFSGKAPSSFHATDCGSGQMQLLIINLATLENVTVALPERAGERTSNAQSQATSSYAAWVLTPPPASGGKSMGRWWEDGQKLPKAAVAGDLARTTATEASPDPFATGVLLNGQLLPDTVGTAAGASMNTGSPPTVEFLEHIPVQPLTGQATIELPPVSVTFLCSSD